MEKKYINDYDEVINAVHVLVGARCMSVLHKYRWAGLEELRKELKFCIDELACHNHEITDYEIRIMDRMHIGVCLKYGKSITTWCHRYTLDSNGYVLDWKHFNDGMTAEKMIYELSNLGRDKIVPLKMEV